MSTMSHALANARKAEHDTYILEQIATDLTDDYVNVHGHRTLLENEARIRRAIASLNGLADKLRRASTAPMQAAE